MPEPWHPRLRWRGATLRPGEDRVLSRRQQGSGVTHPRPGPARGGPRAGTRPAGGQDVRDHAGKDRDTARPRPTGDAPPPWLAQRILHQDAEVLILDKPAGLPVHAGPRGKPSLEDWLPLLQQGKRHLPQPAHRLDADTAGCLALGRTKPALAALGALFAAGRAEKTYWAVALGSPADESGTVDAPLRKVSTARTGWRMEPHPEGQPARTAWRVLGRGPGLTWLELRPATGRTHQLRLHCGMICGPILGDPLYGQAAPGGLHLFARALRLPLEPPRAAEAPLPEAMRAGFAACGWMPDEG